MFSPQQAKSATTNNTIWLVMEKHTSVDITKSHHIWKKARQTGKTFRDAGVSPHFNLHEDIKLPLAEGDSPAQTNRDWEGTHKIFMRLGVSFRYKSISFILFSISR